MRLESHNQWQQQKFLAMDSYACKSSSRHNAEIQLARLLESERERERERKESRSAEPRQTSVGSRRRPPDPDVSCVRWCSEPAVINSVRQTGLERKRVHACMHATATFTYMETGCHYGQVWTCMHACMHSVLSTLKKLNGKMVFDN
jgi:hypothetical protein